MSLYINRNPMYSAANLHLDRNQRALESSVSKLSSGLRINSAADDAAGLAISESLRRQVRGLNRAGFNAQDGISMAQVAEGALGETHSIIQRMRELAVQASNDTLTGSDRLEIQKEVDGLRSQIDTISNSTEFNTKKLLNGNRSAITSSNSQSISAIARGAAENGTYKVELSTVSGGVSQAQDSSLFSGNGSVTSVTGGTKLSDISNFYDKNGEYLLSNNQQLTLTGNGRSASFDVNGSMTLNNLAAKIQETAEANLGISGTRVSVDTSDNVASMRISSGKSGAAGDISIAGNSNLLDALGFGVTRQSQEAQVSVKIQDNFGNSGSAVTSGNVASGLLEGIDVAFDSSAAQIAGVGGIVDGVKLESAISFSITKDGGSARSVNIGNGSWSLDGIARAINATTGFAGDGFNASVVDNQIKITNNSAGFSISGASANTLGFTNDTYSGSAVSNIDDSARMQGVSKFQKSGNSGNLSFTVNSKSIASYGLVGSTSADLMSVSDLISSVNATLKTQNAGATFDVVDGSLVFTSDVVGADASGNRSSLTMAGVTDDTAKQYGIKNGTAYGSGDGTALIRVTDTASHIQIGNDAGDYMKMAVGDMSAKALGLDKIDLSSINSAKKSMGVLDNALSMVSSERSKLGAYSNRLSSSYNSIQNAYNNLSNAESRIRDVDMASEILELARGQLLNDVGTSMIAQSNTYSSNVMKLLDSYS